MTEEEEKLTQTSGSADAPESAGAEPQENCFEEEVLELGEEEKSAEDLLKERLQAAETLVNQLKDEKLRLLAEAENARRRHAKEKKESVQFAEKMLLQDFLGVLDNFDRALAVRLPKESNAEAQMLQTGLTMIDSSFKELMAKKNVQPIQTEGKKFDPHYHEAVSEKASEEAEPGTILSVSQKGYVMGDVLLRPALVVVAKSASEDTGS